MRNDYTINSEAYQRSIDWLQKMATAKSYDQLHDSRIALELGLQKLISDGLVIDEQAYKQCKHYQQYLAKNRKS